MSKIACLFFHTSVSCAAIAPSYFTVTLHVVNNIFRLRPYQSYASFLLLLPWTAQLLVTTHTPSNWYGANSCLCQRRCRGVREKWNIWGTMKSLLPVQQTKVPLPFCLLYLFPSPSSQVEANLFCCFMSLYSTSITFEVLFTPVWLVITWQACKEHNKHTNWSTKWRFNAFVDLYCHLVYNLIWLRCDWSPLCYCQ